MRTDGSCSVHCRTVDALTSTTIATASSRRAGNRVRSARIDTLQSNPAESPARCQGLRASSATGLYSITTYRHSRATSFGADVLADLLARTAPSSSTDGIP